jgi:hypothetical protein
MKPLDKVMKGDVLDDDQDPNVPAHLRFAVLWWKALTPPESGVVAAFENMDDADDWARLTAHSDLHNNTCERIYLVVERGTRTVHARHRCSGSYCRCAP